MRERYRIKVNGVGRGRESLSFFVYLNFAIVLPTSLFQNGFWRFALLLVFVLYLLIVLGSRHAIVALDGFLARAGALGRLALFETMPVTVLIMSLTSPNKVRIWEASIVVVLVAGLLWRDWHAQRLPAKNRLDTLRFGWALIGLALSVPLLNLASGMLVPKLSDVATTTVDAARMVLQGHDPYSAALDPFGAINAHNAAFGGYKYLPLMILFYLPFVVPFGSMAVLWANALLVAGLCAAVWALSRGNTDAAGHGDNRLVAIAVLLATPELSETSLAMGYNDVPGTLLVLAAFIVRGRSALLAGLLVGCSLSFKLMPGLVAATILFPPDRWKPYVTGMVFGLLPTALFLTWDAEALVRNVLVFNLVRSPDPTSWRLLVPSWIGRAASLGALSVWLAGSVWLALRSWRGKAVAVLDHEVPDARLILFVIASLLLIMTGLTAHDDYMIWWMPAVIAIFAREGDQRHAPA